MDHRHVHQAKCHNQEIPIEHKEQQEEKEEKLNRSIGLIGSPAPLTSSSSSPQSSSASSSSSSLSRHKSSSGCHSREACNLLDSLTLSNTGKQSRNENATRDKNNTNKMAADDGLRNDSLASKLNKIVCIDDFEELARVNLEKGVYDYYKSGADDEKTLAWNRTMISHCYCLRPRIMCNVSQIDLTKYVFGDKLSMPIGISPTAMHKMAHQGGELATVRACNRINALMILSLFSTTSLEDVAREAPICTKWQNIYILKDRELTQNVINRAMRFGYRALVVTCDAPTLGNRRNDSRNNFSLGKFTLENIEDNRIKELREHSSEIFDPSVCWRDLADLKKSVGDSIRVIAKGIMTPEDAELALEAKVDAIFVSNHGGRQLDGALSTIEALPEIVRVVNKRCPVFVDGGFRTGAEILKALALGADMVFIGRPVLWALASHGEEGVYRALKLLQEELIKAMMLCGRSKLSDIKGDVVIGRKNLQGIERK